MLRVWNQGFFNPHALINVIMEKTLFIPQKGGKNEQAKNKYLRSSE